MKKVAVFGNPSGGKSTLSRKLSEITNLPLKAHCYPRLNFADSRRTHVNPLLIQQRPKTKL
ncbi:MAG: hypothetical protein AB4057_01605 [Crocosphaera sp.]